MQENIIQSINLSTPSSQLESYCLMWDLRPYINDNVMRLAWKYVPWWAIYVWRSVLSNESEQVYWWKLFKVLSFPLIFFTIPNFHRMEFVEVNQSLISLIPDLVYINELFMLCKRCFIVWLWVKLIPLVRLMAWPWIWVLVCVCTF